MNSKAKRKEIEWLEYLKRQGVRQYISVVEGKEVFRGTVDERIKQLQ